ncbi:hypothetical protein D3C77_720930 [compost metagenome]
MCDIVNAYANDLSGGGNDRIQLHIAEGVVGCGACGIDLRLLQQGGVGQQTGQIDCGGVLLGQVDNIAFNYCPEARLAVFVIRN